MKDKSMLVERLLPAAREKLVTIADDPLIQAAKLLRAGTDLVIVYDSVGLLSGVITKTDVVRQISSCQGAACMTPVSLTMTRDATICRLDDWLGEVWSKMKSVDPCQSRAARWRHA